MEVTYNDFSNDDVISSIKLKSETAISQCQSLLKFNGKKQKTNKNIVIWINDLHRCLDNEYEVGVKITHLGKEIVFYIDHIAHQNQSMIYFKGHTVKGKLVHFVKPSAELDIELEALESRSPDSAKSPFGFADWNVFDEVKELNI